MRGQDFGLLSLKETLEALLPVRKSERWLNTYLNNNPSWSISANGVSPKYLISGATYRLRLPASI